MYDSRKHSIEQSPFKIEVNYSDSETLCWTNYIVLLQSLLFHAALCFTRPSLCRKVCSGRKVSVFGLNIFLSIISGVKGQNNAAAALQEAGTGRLIYIFTLSSQ